MPFQFSEGMPSSLFRKPQTWVNWRWTSLSQTQFTLKFKSFLVQEIPLPFSTIFFLEFGPSQTISILSKDQIQWGLKFNYKLRYFPWINIYTAWLSSGSFLPVSCYTCVAGEAEEVSQQMLCAFLEITASDWKWNFQSHFIYCCITKHLWSFFGIVWHRARRCW